MSKLGIYFVTPQFEKASTGPAVYALYLWEHFEDNPDFDFHIVTANSDIRHSRVHSLQLTTLSGSAFYDPIARLALSLARKHKGQAVIHGNATHIVAACLGCEYPLVVQVNDYETAEVLRSPVSVLRQSGLRRLIALMWRQRRERMVLQSADYALCNSEFVRRQMLDSYRRLDPEKFKIIYKAVDTRHFARPDVLPPDPWGDQATGFRVLTVGLNWRRKGIPDLIEAVAVAKRDLSGLRLMIVGPSSQHDRDAIDRIAAKSGIADCVTVAGRVERQHLGSYFWHADLFALPSHTEALPLSVLEALASGVPVVCSNVGGLSEIFRGSGDGLTVSAGQPAELAAAILRLANDPSLRTGLAQRGPLRARAFSVENTVSQVRKFYLQIAEA